MAKKRPKKEPIEAIQFRPGGKLGELINEFAGIWRISRGEAAKRLTALAAHKLDLEFAASVQDLAGCLYGAENFVDACQMVCVMLNEVESTPQSQQVQIVRRNVDLYKSLKGIQKEVAENRVSVKLYRT
ncbi:hypothetical protein [Anatilimnocola floriformis]|uniref:hypothetical protein n=1 Tax=Anatilimnocola floriformis TaxID=2948575 RepID=UPI0020C4A571|nr:hypothetical protein [Anatilimnocola floriformis]